MRNRLGVLVLSMAVVACAGRDRPRDAHAPPEHIDVASERASSTGAAASALHEDGPPVPTNRDASVLPPGCVERASFDAMLGDDASPSRIRSVRCGPAEAAYTDDGGIAYPVDTLTLTHAGTTLVLHSNAESPGETEVDYARAVRLEPGRGSQLSYSIHSYGTGNIHDWHILDHVRGARHEWQVVGTAHTRAVLHPDEHVGKQVGLGVVEHDGVFVVTNAVYRSGDPNCCPTGGAISVELVPKNGALETRREWRHALP